MLARYCMKKTQSAKMNYGFDDACADAFLLIWSNYRNTSNGKLDCGEEYCTVDGQYTCCKYEVWLCSLHNQLLTKLSCIFYMKLVTCTVRLSIKNTV